MATTTSLVGTVTDSSGQSVPNAKITAVEEGSLTTYNTTTNVAGYFAVDFVRVGTYSITVDQPGFQKVTKTGIQVNINQTVRTDFRL
ncbi:MAG: carboxypeptidase regulatory-like domain-containing protein, partial [Bryobacterales bacterium]|nr:carboxypeptidase regulatory-like domain-containing protein [Bryobacterales bacterium]